MDFIINYDIPYGWRTGGGGMNTKDEIKKELKKLYEFGLGILSDETIRNTNNEKNSKRTTLKNVVVSTIPEIQSTYNQWYTAVLPLIKLLVRERYNDFIDYFKLVKRKENYYNTFEYTISDYLNNDREILKAIDNFDEFNTFSIKFKNQLAILNACIENIDNILFDIENVLQYNMYKSELEAAKGLLKKGFIRPAGALAGVVLERYLKEICLKHEIKLNKNKRTMAGYNEALKASNIIDQVFWRNIQRLGDIRNCCDHPAECDPQKEEVESLISETENIIAKII